jgi:aerobic-type carbon monoxide dehydrogenase small subunit (CoxS/CutS family)
MTTTELTVNVDINVNGRRRSFTADPETPLLWVLRDHLAASR